jgi:hypothetical protein
MRNGYLPATPKQLAVLRGLGVEHGAGMNRADASPGPRGQGSERPARGLGVGQLRLI